jgi:glyoxylase-like metal-dependent hydrolase (beta-lactamase superfamily II)
MPGLPGAGAPAVFEVYALRYAHREAVRSEHFYRHGPGGDQPMPMDYYVWAAVSPQAVVVIDAGFTPVVARRRGRTHLASPVDLLAEIGIAASDVQHMVITHLHYDHTGYVSAFPAACFLLQEAEMAFWTGRHAGRGEYAGLCEPDDLAFLVRANAAGRVHQVSGDHQVVPGITVHHVGGHTPGLQVVRVRTADGHVVLASDASHYDANIDEDRPFSIVHTLPMMYDAFDRVRELASNRDLVVPGHDPGVRERFPAVVSQTGGSIVSIVPAQSIRGGQRDAGART